jgi:hypothetical protein
VGFEVDHTTTADLNGVIPDQRWDGYLLPTDGQLRYTPANRQNAPLTSDPESA